MKSFINQIIRRSKVRVARRIASAVEKLPSTQGVTLIDIGAAGDIEPRWKSIERHLNYFGFEPDARSRSLMLRKNSLCREYTLHPFAAAEKTGLLSLNLCRTPQVSSSFLPDSRFTDLFPDPRRFDVLERCELDSKAIDELGISAPHFIKLDIQGGELNALKGSGTTLKNTLGLEVEIEFLPIYQKQPLFGDISEFLSSQGFVFMDFVNLCRWERHSHNGFGQCVFGDALFLRTPEDVVIEHASEESICTYLAILLLYKRYDLIDLSLFLLPPNEKNKYTSFTKEILRLRKSDATARRINHFINRILNVVGQDYRSHLIY